MSARLAEALQSLPPRADSYLSPTGAFTVTGVAELIARGCDVVVLEEGLGGASDEVSLFRPSVVAVTPIFAEHVGLLGDNVTEIAHDLLAVISPTTRAVVSTPQERSIAELLANTARSAGAGLTWAQGSEDNPVPAARGLSRANATAGIQAASALLDQLDVSAHARSLDLLASVTLPGRLTQIEREGTQWIIDSAIEAQGAAAALAWCNTNVAAPDLVLLGLPDIKPVADTLRVFDGIRVVGVSAGETHLTYNSDAWTTPVVPWRHAIELANNHAVATVLCVGTISFVGEILEYLDIDCDRVYGPV
jgi:dihydrofolate synthase/folylpolyglutamate synthase